MVNNERENMETIITVHEKITSEKLGEATAQQNSAKNEQQYWNMLKDNYKCREWWGEFYINLKVEHLTKRGTIEAQ